MVPFVSSIVNAVSCYFEITVAEPCGKLHETAVARTRKNTPRSSYSLVDLVRKQHKMMSPEVPYIPVDSNQPLTRLYLEQK